MQPSFLGTDNSYLLACVKRHPARLRAVAVVDPTIDGRGLGGLTRRAMAIARRSGDADLEVFALSLLGLSEVHAGRLAAGMELMEEAMAAATAGRVRNVHTLAEAYCNLIKAATDAGDWDRATEWCDHVDRFARDTGAIPLLGTCRTIHADVLVARGRWIEGGAWHRSRCGSWPR